MSRPASKFVDQLTEEDVQFLQQVWREHRVYTVRCRAHAILLSSQGYSVSDIQDVFGISKPTALAWIDRWQEHGRDGLEDEPRSGGPPILDEQEQAIFEQELARSPREPKKVIQAVIEHTGKSISRSTMRRLARKLDYRWKRFRRSMRKHRDERQFRLAMEEIEALRSELQLELAFFDESAFSLRGIVPYGWQRIGERIEIPIGDEGGNVQVLGIQEEHGDTFGYLHRGRVYGTTVAEIIEDYCQRIPRPTVLILDNASVHTAGAVMDQMDKWNSRGLYFYFLPPHCPELNAIERLWDKLKYQKLPANAWESLSSLVGSLVNVFTDIGQAFVMPSLQQ